MKKSASLLISVFLSIAFSGCATRSLNAPCPDYGRYCKKTPINSWNYKK